MLPFPVWYLENWGVEAGTFVTASQVEHTAGGQRKDDCGALAAVWQPAAGRRCSNPKAHGVQPPPRCLTAPQGPGGPCHHHHRHQSQHHPALPPDTLPIAHPGQP